MALYVDIRKKLGDFELRVSFETKEGVTGILGASGSGKSMTLRCIAGVVRPDEGRIELDGTVLFDSKKGIHQKPQFRQTGLLFQNYALFPNMTVRQNLKAGVRAREKDPKKAEQKINEMMERFCLEGLGDYRPCQLSGGHQQRTALARILLSRPRVLLLDEPFSALDGYLKWNLELELAGVLREYKGSTLFVSHSRDEIYRMCDRVCVMDQGTSSPVIPVRQLFDAPVSKAAALLSGCKNYSRAHPAGKGKVYAEDWNVTLEYEGEAPEGFCCLGVRSHYFRFVPAGEAKDQKNTFCCRILQVIEDVFSMIVMLCPTAAEETVSKGARGIQIRAELTKEQWERFRSQEDLSEGVWIHVNPEDVMLLK